MPEIRDFFFLFGRLSGHIFFISPKFVTVMQPPMVSDLNGSY